jgi:hypothetical protein
MVDLGLPSGLKWAKTNIGAIEPEKGGLLYAWGEILPKTQYDFTDYKFTATTNADGAIQTFYKYITNAEFGTIDGLKKLEDADDAAIQNLGDGWRMPTLADFNELLENCEISHTTINDQNGTLFTGKNGNSIFMPWVGTMFQGNLEYDMRGYYWSSTLDEESDKCAKGLFMAEKFDQIGKLFTRCSGRCIRPVHD